MAMCICWPIPSKLANYHQLSPTNKPTMEEKLCYMKTTSIWRSVMARNTLFGDVRGIEANVQSEWQVVVSKSTCSVLSPSLKLFINRSSWFCGNWKLTSWEANLVEVHFVKVDFVGPTQYFMMHTQLRVFTHSSLTITLLHNIKQCRASVIHNTVLNSIHISNTTGQPNVTTQLTVTLTLCVHSHKSYISDKSQQNGQSESTVIHSSD